VGGGGRRKTGKGRKYKITTRIYFSKPNVRSTLGRTGNLSGPIKRGGGGEENRGENGEQNTWGGFGSVMRELSWVASPRFGLQSLSKANEFSKCCTFPASMEEAEGKFRNGGCQNYGSPMRHPLAGLSREKWGRDKTTPLRTLQTKPSLLESRGKINRGSGESH